MQNLRFEDFKKTIRVKVLYLCTILCVLVGGGFLTGCSQVNTSSDLYQSIQQQTSQFTTDASSRKEYSAAYLTEKAYAFCNNCKAAAPIVIPISIFIGALILHIVSEDQAIRRKAWAIFIFGIPGLMLLFAFGLSWLVGAFL